LSAGAGGSADVDAQGAPAPDGAAAGLAAVGDATAVGDPEADRLGVGDPAGVVGAAVVGRGAPGGAAEPPTTMSELPLLWYPSVAMIM
jgi:hypothetical protein